MHRNLTLFGKLFAIAVFGSLLSAGAGYAAPINVDGSVTDWGFSIADNDASTFVPAGGIGLVGLFTEDQDDNAGDGGVVGPNSGGQNYDAEALGVAVQSSTLFIAIVSGQRPDNGLVRYGPGDIRVTTNVGTYGIEVGGGAGGGAGTMLSDGASGSTYTLDSNGFTQSHATADPAQTTGSVWLNPSWILDPIPPQEQTQLQIGGGGTHVGDATYRFTRDSVTSQHSIIELSLPLSIFGGQTIQGIEWFPACGNDELSIGMSIPTPEPGTLVLAAVGLIGLLAWGWRKRLA